MAGTGGAVRDLVNMGGGLERTNDTSPMVYNASAFPSSAECSNRSKALIALARRSSPRFLEPRPSPSLVKLEDTRFVMRWCSLRIIRTALPTGP